MLKHYPAELKNNPSVGIKISIFLYLCALSIKPKVQAAALTSAASANVILWIDVLEPITKIAVALVGVFIALSGVYFAYRKDKREQEAHDNKG